jgi:hypothetical protein
MLGDLAPEVREMGVSRRASRHANQRSKAQPEVVGFDNDLKAVDRRVIHQVINTGKLSRVEFTELGVLEALPHEWKSNHPHALRREVVNLGVRRIGVIDSKGAYHGRAEFSAGQINSDQKRVIHEFLAVVSNFSLQRLGCRATPLYFRPSPFRGPLAGLARSRASRERPGEHLQLKVV